MVAPMPGACLVCAFYLVCFVLFLFFFPFPFHFACLDTNVQYKTSRRKTSHYKHLCFTSRKEVSWRRGKSRASAAIRRRTDMLCRNTARGTQRQIHDPTSAALPPVFVPLSPLGSQLCHPLLWNQNPRQRGSLTLHPVAPRSVTSRQDRCKALRESSTATPTFHAGVCASSLTARSKT